MKKLFSTIFLLLALQYTIGAQQIVINEVMPANRTVIPDEDRDYPDWIELYNRGQAPFNLAGFYLSDDSSQVNKWQFPAVVLDPQQFLLLFASGKNRRNWVAHWETVIDWGDEWHYRLGDSEPPASWMWVGFNDSSWLSGKSGFGYSDNDDSTIVAQTISLYLRKSFYISSVEYVVAAILHIDYDDAFVAYLNGYEIARANIGEAGYIPPHDRSADTDHEANMYRGGKPETFPVANIQEIIKPGENVLAVQVHNYKTDSSDLTLIPYFTIGFSETPDSSRGLADGIDVVPVYLHTNFKIKSSGETIYLTDSSAAVMDWVSTGVLQPDVSFGRKPDGADSWYIFAESTPNSANSTEGMQGSLPEPVFSEKSGFYTNPLQLSLSVSEPGATIRYTMDGSEPTDSSSIYSEPITIDRTKVIRAKAFQTGKMPGGTVTHTYFIDENISLPVISLATAPENFWDQNTGIYVKGANAQPDFPYFDANFWQDWEKPVHLEFFETDGNLAFQQNAGVKIFGGWSRGFRQKSLAVFARNRYGDKEINYQIFPDKPIKKFKSLVLRNSGNDWNHAMMRDAMMQRLMKGMHIITQAYRPAVLFINGEYWGIHNIREKINEHTIAANNKGVDPKKIDFLEFDNVVIAGDELHYNDMIAFITDHDLSVQENYEHVKTLMDVENFIDYQIAEIYVNNQDWPASNIKFWRPKTADGKWRWLLYDTDAGFGLYFPDADTTNTLKYATAPNGNEESNPPWSTFLLRSLLHNQQCKQYFINRFADLMNTNFDPDTMTKVILEMKAGIEAEIPRHLQRWNLDLSHWQDEMNVLLNFAKSRNKYVRTHIMEKFNLGGVVKLVLNVSPEGGGDIRINSLRPSSLPWQGFYFQDNPLQLTAVPEPGFRFTGWSGDLQSNDISASFYLTHDAAVTAVFGPDSLIHYPVVINEINYMPGPDFDAGDWIELYQYGDQPLDLSGWYLRDSDDGHLFVIPENTLLNPDSYLVLCEDTTKFKMQFPQVKNYCGNFDFGLSSGGELVRLYEDHGGLVDSLTYDSVLPWPPEPGGMGATLALKDPELDNARSASWYASPQPGTPGSRNDTELGTDDKTTESLPPKSIRVRQNYPNPFNGETVIRFELPHRNHVTITVFNATGRKIAGLVNKTMPAGIRQVKWRPDGGITSGVYFFRIQVGKSWLKLKKVVYIK